MVVNFSNYFNHFLIFLIRIFLNLNLENYFDLDEENLTYHLLIAELTNFLLRLLKINFSGNCLRLIKHFTCFALIIYFPYLNFVIKTFLMALIILLFLILRLLVLKLKLLRLNRLPLLDKILIFSITENANHLNFLIKLSFLIICTRFNSFLLYRGSRNETAIITATY